MLGQGHALNLACSDAVKNCQIMKNSLDTCYEIIKLVKKLPRREAIFQNLKKHITEDFPGARILCPTRWTVHANALESISATSIFSINSGRSHY